MDILKKSSCGFQSISLDTALLDQRKVFLNGTITTESVGLVIKELLYLKSVDNTIPIQLYINSTGGSVSAALALYDLLKGMNNVDIYCYEIAASIAAVILAGGQRGHRFILNHSKVLIHEPLVSSDSGGLCGSASEIVKSAEDIMKTKKTLIKLLSMDTGRTFDEIEKAISFDNLMSADEAVSFGICDAIVNHM